MLQEFKTFIAKGNAIDLAAMVPNSLDVQMRQVNVKRTLAKVAAEKWPKNGAALLATAFKKDKTCYRDGADKAAQYDGYEGNMYLTAIRQEKDGRPIVIDRNRAPLVEADGKIYSGCYVNLKVDLWAQDNQYGQTVRATLLVVQFVRDGDSFGGAKKPVVDDMPDLGVDEATTEGAGLI